jgi:hypothetical protein
MSLKGMFKKTREGSVAQLAPLSPDVAQKFEFNDDDEDKD